jgi:hypothetical protein
MSIAIRHIAFSAATSAAAWAISWIVLDESSPAYHFFLYHVSLPNIWRLLNLLPFVFAALTSGNVHNPSSLPLVVAFTAQWALFGLLASLVIHKLRPNKSFKPNPLRGSA